MPFRIGRRLARHFYPEPRGGSSTPQLARNFATGPKTNASISTIGTTVLWNGIDAGPSPSFDVQITPISTGVIRVTGTIVVANNSGAPLSALVQIVLDSGSPEPLPLTDKTTIRANGFAVIPFQAEVTLSLGLHTVAILITAEGDGALVAPQDSSALSLQEVPVSTG